MNMKRMTLALTLAAVLVSPAFADVIYREDFDGDGTSLNEKMATVRPGSEQWSANDVFKRDGTVAAGGNDYRAAYLPFTPESGNVYKLTAALSATYVASQDSNILVGFAGTTIDAGINTAHGYAMGELEAHSGGTTHSINGLTGKGPAGESSLASGVTLAGSGVVTFEITLDASDASAANWTAAWSATDGTTTWTKAATTAADLSYGNIQSLALFTREGQGVFDYVQLETVVPEPGSMALLALGATCLLLRTRK